MDNITEVVVKVTQGPTTKLLPLSSSHSDMVCLPLGHVTIIVRDLLMLARLFGWTLSRLIQGLEERRFSIASSTMGDSIAERRS